MRSTIDLPPGIFGDDTSFAAAGRYRDANNVRWWRGKWQTVGGWERLTTTALSGVCRSVLPWTDNNAVLNVAFGTHTHLELYQSGAIYDITPTLARPSFDLADNPVTTTNTSASIVLTVPTGHGLAVDDSITLTGLSAVATVTINGTWTLTAVSATTVTFTAGSAANADATGGGTSGVLAPQEAFATGAESGTGGAGYGTGAYGVGDYSEPSTSDYWPRTWALSPFGQALVANPRGGAVFMWENDTGVVAAPILNSPRQVSYALVGPNDEIFALGCNEETSGDFNHLCIRHSGVRTALGPKYDVWNTDPATTAREYILRGGGRIVAGRVIGEYLLVWTTHSLYLGAYIGNPGQVWRFTQVPGSNCGLVAPGAVVTVGHSAYWLGPDLQFRSYTLGGAPQVIPCPIRDDMADNMASGQMDKIVASSIGTYNEVRFDYPDSRDGDENSRYLTLSLLDGSWSRGEMARSAFVDAGPSEYPIGVDPSGNVYWQEKGHSADGGAITWHIETADLYLDESTITTLLEVRPDVEDQVGPMTITDTSRLKPQGDERTQAVVAGVGDDKLDFRLSGLLHRIKYSGSSAPAYARVGKTTVAFASGGRR